MSAKASRKASFFFVCMEMELGKKIIIIPFAMFAPRWTSEVFWSPPCWKSWSSLGRVRPRSVATLRQAARLCLHRLQLLLSCCGDTCAHGLFVVLHLQRQWRNRELRLIRHANILCVCVGGTKGQPNYETGELGKTSAGETCWGPGDPDLLKINEV